MIGRGVAGARRGMPIVMTVESESDRPNEFGFSGDATAPQPERTSSGETEAERVAVPADDLTGAISDGIDNATQGDDADR